MRSKELSIELRDRFVSRDRSEERYQNISAALKVPKYTVGSIILKWKKFGTTKTPRAGRLAKLSNQGRRALVREVTQNPMVTLTELQSSSVKMEKLPEGQPSLQHSPNQAFMVEWPDGSHSSVKGTTDHLEFAKRHRKDSQTMGNKIILSEETKIEPSLC